MLAQRNAAASLTTTSWTDSGLAFLSIVAVVCCAYSNALTGDFAYDDHFAIRNNADANGNAPWLDMWYHDYWGQDISKEDSHKSYRPLTTLTFRINFFLHSKFLNDTGDPHVSYQRLMMQLHATNVILHSLVSWQVKKLASSCLLALSDETATLAALLFAAHPVHTEAVTGLGMSPSTLPD